MQEPSIYSLFSLSLPNFYCKQTTMAYQVKFFIDLKKFSNKVFSIREKHEDNHVIDKISSEFEKKTNY